MSISFAAGPRIASMNVCGDQLVLSLADPDQIIGLSRFSRDAWQSWAAEKARNFPRLSGEAEDVLLLKPDLVVVSLFDKRATRDLLKANGLHLVEFTVPRTLDEVKDQIRAMGDVVQHPDRAEAEIARLDAATARARAAASAHHYRRAAAGATRLCAWRRQPGQLAAGGNRPRQRRRRTRLQRGRICLAGGDRKTAAGFHPGVGSRRPRRG
ncbi:ABC transporter substrate-binding protein [Bradyrhizobium sp. 13971]